ncbi:MAG: hypothetical protein ACRDD7_04285 [Peptostreptococcaceae bacterium]
MNKYFVVFNVESVHTGNDLVVQRNGVIEYSTNITDLQDIINIEKIIQEEYFGASSAITLINYKKLD